MWEETFDLLYHLVCVHCLAVGGCPREGGHLLYYISIVSWVYIHVRYQNVPKYWPNVHQIKTLSCTYNCFRKMYYLTVSKHFVSVFALIFDPIDPLFHWSFDPSFWRNLRSDWDQFFFVCAERPPPRENLVKHPPLLTLYQLVTIFQLISHPKKLPICRGFLILMHGWVNVGIKESLRFPPVILTCQHSLAWHFRQGLKVIKRYPFCAKVARIHTLIMGQRRTVPDVEKQTSSRVFACSDGIICWPSGLPGWL